MLWNLMSCQLKTFYREPGVLFWVFGFPILMAWVLGIAFSGEKERSRGIGWVGDPAALTALVAEGRAHMDGEVWVIEAPGPTTEHLRLSRLNEAEATTWLLHGKVDLLVGPGEGIGLKYRFDPNNQEAQVGYLLLQAAFDAPQLRPHQVEKITTRGGRYIDFLVPGLMALGIMNSCIWGIGWTLIEMRMKKLLRRMVATPMPKPVLLAAYFLNRLIISSIESAVLYGFAWAYFGMSLQGGLLALFGLILAGNFAFSGMAVLMASRTANTTVGGGLVNVTTLPMMVLSGIFFSYHNFPQWSWPYLSHLPLSLLADGLREVIHEGAGLADMASSMGWLALLGLVCYALGLKVFKWY
ncbi:MAG: ABC transporter permease [bacterium]|nr:ABC transporter permease [bacterium]